MPETEIPVTKTCLNGWWDIIPCYEAPVAYDVPRDGWLAGQYLVPSFWTKPTSAVRHVGESTYGVQTDPAIFNAEEPEFLFDAFGYPSAWSKTRSAWVRRTVTINELDPTRRFFLIFDAVMPKSHLFVNGHRVALHIQPTLPLEADVTQWLRVGENEMAVLIEDYDRDDRARAEVPTGNTIPCNHSGIWQDVWLVTRAEVFINDISIRTSTREKTLSVHFEVTNASSHPRTVTRARCQELDESRRSYAGKGGAGAAHARHRSRAGRHDCDRAHCGLGKRRVVVPREPQALLAQNR